MMLAENEDETVERSDRSLGKAGRDSRLGELVGGRYRVLKRIGAGGMGDVYAAEHVRLGRQFALKFLREVGERKATDRFRREAKAIARIENEYVVSIVDCGEGSDGTPYIVMDLLRGEDLRSLLEHASPLPIPRAVRLVCDACHGVTAVHRAGLVHRDLKPANLFVMKRATGEDWCKVLDFGITKTESSASTAEGALLGTVRYMAPEQLKDGASAGQRADIYALGAILYEALSGTAPHSGTSPHELMFKTMNEEPLRLDRRRPEVPAALADAVHRALAKRVDKRFESCEAFFRVISPFARAGGAELVEASSTIQTVILDPHQRSVSAAAPRVSMWVGVVCALAAGTAWTMSQANRQQPLNNVAKPPTPTWSTFPEAAIGVPSSDSAFVDAPRPAQSASDPRPNDHTTVTRHSTHPISAHPTEPRLPKTRFDTDNPYDR